MTLLKHRDKLRALVPQGARERLYEWHPGRARRWRRFPGIECCDAPGHAVLTFDDGPDAEATPAVLDALDAAGARATFFLLGSQVETAPALAREIAGRGHEIALHGYAHVRHDRISAADSQEDIRRGLDTLEDVVGIRARLYRPPYGKMSPAAADSCRELGLTVVYWSAWGLDWEDVDATRIAQVVSTQMGDRSIILLHDSARFARRPSAAPTAAAIGAIARHARVSQLNLVALRAASSGVAPEVTV